MTRPLFFIAAAVLTVAPALSGCGWINKAAAEDTKIVVFSPGPATTIAIDGGEAVDVSAGAFKSVAVGPGEHKVVIDGDREVSVTLEAFDRWVVPAVENQCFFGIDVAASHYSADGKNSLGGPKIAKRRQDSEPFKFPLHHHLTEDELPESAASGTLLYILRSLPCEEVDALESGMQQ